MDEKSFQAITKKSPFIAWIHNISLNHEKYMKTKFKNLNLGHDIRYIMFIYDNPNCSQEDIVKMFSQSKGNVAKIIKKLEDEKYIKREINPKNRRKYMLNTTEKGSKLIPQYREISKEWENNVGLTSNDEELIEQIKKIAINGMKLTENQIKGE